MAEKFRSFIKVLNNEINKHQLFNATTRISSVTGKAQEKLNNIQSAVAAKYDVLAKVLHFIYSSINIKNYNVRMFKYKSFKFIYSSKSVMI